MAGPTGFSNTSTLARRVRDARVGRDPQADMIGRGTHAPTGKSRNTPYSMPSTRTTKATGSKPPS